MNSYAEAHLNLLILVYSRYERGKANNILTKYTLVVNSKTNITIIDTLQPFREIQEMVHLLKRRIR